MTIAADKTLAKLSESDPDLSEEELLWLRDQDRLPKHLRESLQHLPVTFGVEGSDHRVSNDPSALAQQQLETSGLFQDMVDKRAKELAAQLLREQQQGSMNVLVGENTGRESNSPVEVTHGSNPEPAGPPNGEEEDTNVPPYDQWSVTDLRAEAANRGLDPSGNKAALAQRLEENDREDEANRSKSSDSGSGDGNQGS